MNREEPDESMRWRCDSAVGEKLGEALHKTIIRLFDVRHSRRRAEEDLVDICEEEQRRDREITEYVNFLAQFQPLMLRRVAWQIAKDRVSLDDTVPGAIRRLIEAVPNRDETWPTPAIASAAVEKIDDTGRCDTGHEFPRENSENL
jgi:hypothetical protein